MPALLKFMLEAAKGEPVQVVNSPYYVVQNGANALIIYSLESSWVFRALDHSCLFTQINHIFIRSLTFANFRFFYAVSKCKGNRIISKVRVGLERFQRIGQYFNLQ